jgi:hypothetical protein
MEGCIVETLDMATEIRSPEFSREDLPGKLI